MGGRPGQAKTGGRKVGTPNKATAAIRELARTDGPAVFKELVRLAFESKSDMRGPDGERTFDRLAMKGGE